MTDTELDALADELDGLLPELEFARQTHVEWRDCDLRLASLWCRLTVGTHTSL